MAKKKSKNSKIIFFFLLGIVIFGGYYTLTGNDPLGLFEGVEDAGISSVEVAEGAEAVNNLTVPVVESATQGDWWEVYFVDYINHNDPEHYENTIESVIIKKIDNAQSSIHIASFEFDLTPVAEALIRAQKRGVDVRWVTDDEHGLEADEEPDRGQFELLEDAGIEIKDDQRGALMHNKFWVFDRKTVWTGSTNITKNGIFEQDNNVIVIHSPALAEIYEREFDEMWAGEFGPRSTSTVGNQHISIDGTEIQVLFSSEDDVIEHLFPYLENAQKSIHFLAFSFTHDDMGEVMRTKNQEGLTVMGVFEKTGSSTEYSELSKMYCDAMQVRRDGNGGFLHHKVIIIDERIVITGSLNFSDNANESNDENVIIIDNAEIASLYIQEFNRIWAMASDPAPDKFDCP